MPQAVAATSNTRSLAFDPTSGGQSQPRQLPFWMELAIKLGKRFLRVAAAGVPPAGLKFVPHRDEPHSAYCHECGHNHPMLVDEYYFWLVDTQFYAYTDDTDAQSGDASFTGSYQFGFKDFLLRSIPAAVRRMGRRGPGPSTACEVAAKPRRPSCLVSVPQQSIRTDQEIRRVRSDLRPRRSHLSAEPGTQFDFQVSGGTTPPPPGYTDNSPPGFSISICRRTRRSRFRKSPKRPRRRQSFSLSGRICFFDPFFAYEDPGARLFPESWFSLRSSWQTRCGRTVVSILRSSGTNAHSTRCGRTAPWMSCLDTADEAPPTQDQIAQQAYWIWEQHVRPPAEQNLKDRSRRSDFQCSIAPSLEELPTVKTKEAHAVTARKSRMSRPTPYSDTGLLPNPA